MGYEIQRRRHITDELVLKDCDGNTAHVVPVNLDADTIAGRYVQAQNAIIRAEAILTSGREEALEQYGEAVLSLLALIFGDDGAKTILTHYDGNYTEMLEDIYPYILDQVAPKIREASKDKRKRMKALYRARRRR